MAFLVALIKDAERKLRLILANARFHPGKPWVENNEDKIESFNRLSCLPRIN